MGTADPSTTPKPSEAPKHHEYITDTELTALGSLAVVEAIAMAAENSYRSSVNQAPAFNYCQGPAGIRLEEILRARRVL